MSRSLYTPTYQSWQAMRQRCNNPNHRYYSNYGGRGIRVCARWETYSLFLADMGERPLGTSIDRIDNARGYEPDNCQWSTRSKQHRNYSQNRLITFGSTTKCLQEWCELLDLNYARVYARLVVLKWSTTDAFFG